MATSDDPPVSATTEPRTTTLNSDAPMFFPNRYYHFNPPPQIHHYISNTIHLPPPPPPPPTPPMFYYYPPWFINPNPNPNQFRPPFHSPNPRQELSTLPPPRLANQRYKASVRRRNKVLGPRRNKMIWRKKMRNEVGSNGHDDHSTTTIMLRNIPNKYTRDMMIKFLDEYCGDANQEEDEEMPISAYDFFYLPMDFKTGMNKGYAFVNFTKAEAVWKFKTTCNNMPWRHFGSRKILEVAKARIQGKEDLVSHFEKMTYPVEAYSAVWFSPARRGLTNEVETIMVGKCIKPSTWV